MHGQLYAAFSRVRNFDCDKLLQRILMFIEIKLLQYAKLISVIIPVMNKRIRYICEKIKN
jgi:hypothetical protein